MNTEDCCENCVFYRSESCHRYPPQIVNETYEKLEWGGDVSNVNTNEHYFPYVDLTEWCGEHKRKEEK